MSGSIHIHVRDDVDLSGALLVVGAPGLGFVGSIATRYLVEQLGMERVGGLHSDLFPPYAPVEKGRPLHPVRVHHLETACGLDLKCDRVVVMTSELFPGPAMVDPLAVAILDWADTIDAEMVLVPDAVAAGEDTEEVQPVHGVGTTDRAMALLQKAEVAPLDEGVLMGLTAGLASHAEHRGRDLVSVLAGSKPDHPDARAAAQLVAVLDKLLPGIKLESGPLLKRAEEIEETVRSIRAQMAQQAATGQQVAESPAVSMFH